MDRDETSASDLIHVHLCSSCGRFSLPEQFSSRDNVRGLYECPFCRWTEALNVQVVSRTEVDKRS